MVDVIFQQQAQLRQQRETLESQRRRAMSQQALRQSQTRNALLQRQQQLKQLGQQDQSLQSQLSQLEQQQREQEQQSSGNNEVAEYNYGRKLAMSGKFDLNLSKIARQGFIDAKEGLDNVAKYKKAVKDFQAQQLTGVTSQSQSSQSLVQGPIPKGNYDEALFRATGQLKQDKSKPLYQGPVQRFTDPQYFAETGKLRQLPLVVSAVNQGTFQTDIRRVGQDIKTAYKQNDLPQIVRSTLGTGTSVLFREGVRKTEQGLRDFGVGSDSPLFKQTSFPTSRVVGDLALGSLLVGLSGTSQIAASRYVKNGVVYEIDSAGQVISARPVSEVKGEINNFYNNLVESKAYYSAGNEATLRQQTRDLIKKASTNPKQLEQLKNFYKKAGRDDLFKDIYEQEIGEIARTNKATQQAIKDKPSSLVGAGPITSTSQYAGTGQYERTDMVAGSIPQGKITNPMLLSNMNTAFGQSSFNLNRLGQTNSLGLSTLSTQTSQLGLRSDTVIKQPSRLGSALFSASSTTQRTQQQQRLTQRQALDFFRNRQGRKTGRTGKPFGFNLPEDNIISRKKLSTKDILGFAVEVKKRGKFLSLGKPLSSISEAVTRGIRFVDTDISRSFRIRDIFSGELVDVKQLPFGFTRSKRSSKTFVEQPIKAISTFGEKRTLQIFRKARRSKNVFGF